MKLPPTQTPDSVLLAMRWAFSVMTIVPLIGVAYAIDEKDWSRAAVFAVSFVIFLLALQFTWHMTGRILRFKHRHDRGKADRSA